MSITKKYLFLTLFISIATILGLGGMLLGSYSQIQMLEDKIQQLESQLAQDIESRNQSIQMAGPGAASSPVDRLVKDLSTRFVGDPRSIAEKLRDFLADDPSPQHLAIACKVIADIADNRDALSDQELNWLYQQNFKPAFKRVVAQVLSLRGDNKPLDDYIAQLKPGLSSDNPGERRNTLGELAKNHYVGAANAIAPLVEDADTNVKLDALLALRATGNESHIHYVESLVNHPDPSVSWLANDVINNLQNLSSRARTKLNSVDIAAELPPLEIPSS
jgi:hypothetical protein